MSLIKFERVPPVHEWIEMLNRVINTSPTASGFIGGGAVRDLILGAPIKDIDIFVSDAFRGEVDMQAIQSEFGPPTSIETKSEYESHFGRDLTVWSYGIYQIIAIHNSNMSHESEVRHFDFGLCQAAMDKDGCVHLTEHFIKDMTEKTLTCTRAPLKQCRIDRMQDKFPGYSVISTFGDGLVE